MSKLLAGRYELLEKIGEGGMAVVYKAKDRLLNRYVAIKILRPEYTKDEKFVENFKRESQSAAGLQHPNIVAVYDVGVAGSINYIVMELVEGRPLSEIIEEQAPMDYRTVMDVGKQMASALSLAHKHQIIHRDVKPHNILVTEDGVAKLTDFGIARAISSSGTMTDTNKIIGSVHYFSPEQARGTYVDERSDIYSLGIVLYEMLTGKVPFDGDNPVEVALKHINEDIIPPSKLAKGIPPNLEKLVMKATDKFQTNRYKSADEMLEDLTNIEFVTNYLGSGVGIAAAAKGIKGKSISSEHEKDQEHTSLGTTNSEKKTEIRENPKETDKNISENEKEKKGRLPLMIIMAILLLGVLVFGVLYAMDFFGEKAGEVKVPDVTDMTPEEARAELERYGLIMEQGEDISSDDIGIGRIAQQIPVSGSNVKPGKAVTVKLSSGPGEIGVPDTLNLTYDEAVNLIEAAGLKAVQGQSMHSETVQKDRVVATNPAPRNRVKAGETIVIILSDGPVERTGRVPNLYGISFESESSMRNYLDKYDFTLGSVTEEESDEEPGTIIRQSPGYDTEMEKGTSIDIVIAKEITTVEVPSFIGKTLSEAEDLAGENNLKVEMGSFVDDPTGTGTPGTVFNQSVSQGTRVDKETVITLDIIKDRQPEPEPEPEPTPAPEPEPSPNQNPDQNTDPGTGEDDGSSAQSNTEG